MKKKVLPLNFYKVFNIINVKLVFFLIELESTNNQKLVIFLAINKEILNQKITILNTRLLTFVELN